MVYNPWRGVYSSACMVPSEVYEYVVCVAKAINNNCNGFHGDSRALRECAFYAALYSHCGVVV